MDTPDTISAAPLMTPARPDGTTATIGYGGFWRRVVAYFIDGILLSVLNLFISMAFGMGSIFTIMSMARPDRDPMHNTALIASIVTMYLTIVGVSMICGWLYFALMESSGKQATIGKMALGMKVTDLEGNRISFARASGRFFSKILSSLILCIGYMMVGFTAKKQGLHDFVAGTLVEVRP